MAAENTEVMKGKVQTNIENYLSPSVLGKRKQPDFVSNEELKDTIIGECKKIHHEIADTKAELKSDIVEVRNEQLALRSDVKSNKDSIKAVVTDMSIMKTKMNHMAQDYLATHMDIVGLPESTVFSAKPLAQMVFELLASYGVDPKEAGIMQVSIRSVPPVGESRHVVVVRFTTLEKKYQAINKKVAADKNKRPSIFFSHSLTPTNRTLLWNARQLAKELGNHRAYYAGRDVYFKRDSDAKGHPINSLDDLQTIRANKGLPASSAFTASATTDPSSSSAFTANKPIGGGQK